MDGSYRTEIEARNPPLPGHLRRAVSYLRENSRESLALADLVRASGLSERTLHKQFRRFLGMTPLGYLHRLRLLAGLPP